MICPNCKKDIGKLKKYQYIECDCKKTIMCIEINKKLIVTVLENKEEAK